MSQQGKFVWHDLMCTDLAASKRFYGELFGWKIEKDEHSPYELIHLGEGHIGGLLQLDPKSAPGVPSHWVGYVAVKDIDASVALATKHGGKVHMPKTEIPGTGQFAVVGDPEGAVFAPFQYGATAPKAESDAPPAPGTFCWDELWAADPDKATQYYTSVFGWTTEKMDMGPAGQYTIFRREAKDAKGVAKHAGGMMKKHEMVPRPFWLSYVAVNGIDALAERAKKMGAKVMVPPTEIPNVGRFSVLLDPQNAAIGFLQSAPR